MSRCTTPAPGHDDRQRAAGAESGGVQVRFMPGCLVLSIVLSVVGTILLNLLLRLLT